MENKRKRKSMAMEEKKTTMTMEKTDSDHQLNVHVSIQKGFSFPTITKCTNCCSPRKFHCPFCPPAFFKPITQHSIFKVHLENHLRSAFYLGEYTIHRCAYDCRSRPHYHCLYCPATLIRKKDFSYHMPSCRQAQKWKGQQNSSLLTFDDSDWVTNDESDSTDSDDQEESSSNIAIPNNLNTLVDVQTRKRCTETEPSKCDKMVQTNIDKPQDCDEYYFMSLVKMFKKLSPQKKTEVRMKMERLLFEAEFT